MKKGNKDNKFGVRLKDPDVRQKAFEDYCKHIAEGWPRESFFFDDGYNTACCDTVESYIKSYPNEFPPQKVKKAMAARYKLWLTEGKTLMTGRYIHGSPVVWQTIMRNMFKHIGWDQKELTDNNKVSEPIQTAIKEAKDLAQD